MFNDWRSVFYLLGFLPSIFFTLRFLIQWISSEKQGKSVVAPIFWKLSLAGNILLFVHYFIQFQFPFALIQIGNGAIALRNLDLMLAKKPKTFTFTVGCFVVIFIAVFLAYVGQSYVVLGDIEWMRVPKKTWDITPPQQVAFFWHFTGVFGQALFASRFWVQWWDSEKSKKSELGKLFWWLSIVGGCISLVYFLLIQDLVSVINNGFGLIPYVRNLMLIRRAEKSKQTGAKNVGAG